MTKANYNHIYNALVADDNDIVGKLAYSQYKRQKIEYILAFKEKSTANSRKTPISRRSTT
jgi:hypothetical protein